MTTTSTGILESHVQQLESIKRQKRHLCKYRAKNLSKIIVTFLGFAGLT